MVVLVTIVKEIIGNFENILSILAFTWRALCRDILFAHAEMNVNRERHQREYANITKKHHQMRGNLTILKFKILID